MNLKRHIQITAGDTKNYFPSIVGKVDEIVMNR